MVRDIDQYYLQQEEPIKGCLQYLREHILNKDSNISEAWKYRMPMFCYNGKMFCYLWVHKKLKQPYIGFVEGKKLNHPDLIQEGRARMKILMLDASKDLPVRKIDSILQAAISVYKK